MRRILFDYVCEDWLPITDGRPDITILELWRTDGLRVYRAIDTPDCLTTVDTHGFTIQWPFCSVIEEASLTPTPEIPKPWIPYDVVTDGLRSDELVAFNAWVRRTPTETETETETSTSTHPPHWDEFERPMLVSSAPPIQPFEQLAPLLQQRLPPHIRRLLIDNAIATGATCPLTLEPLTNEDTDTATVTPCGHVFAAPLPTNLQTCPVCRACLASAT
jgi:hypothetical protein